MTQREWQILKFVSVIGVAFVGLHGATTRNWRRWHTVFVVTGAVASIGSAVTERRTAADQEARRGGFRP